MRTGTPERISDSSQPSPQAAPYGRCCCWGRETSHLTLRIRSKVAPRKNGRGGSGNPNQLGSEGKDGEMSTVRDMRFCAAELKGRGKSQSHFKEHSGEKCTKAVTDLPLKSWDELPDSTFSKI
jgi:hypothetical protein